MSFSNKRLFLFFLLYLILFHKDLFASDFKIELDFPFRFILQDSPKFSDPSFNDSSWEKINNNSKTHGKKYSNGIGWYRIIFAGEKIPRNEKIGIYLGKIGDSDEVYLNNVKIGGEGKVGDDFVEATNIIRLYPIPDGIINFNGTNLLAIRVMNTYSLGGLLDSKPIIGNFNMLSLHKTNISRDSEKIDIFFMTFFVLMILISIIIYKCGIKDRSFILFSALILIYGLAYFLGTSFFYNLGLKTRTVQKLIYSLTSITPLVFITFLVSLLKINIKNSIKILSALYALLSIFFMFDVKWEFFKILIDVWLVLTTLAVFISLHYSINSLKKKVYGSLSVFMGLLIIILGAGTWILEITGLVKLPNLKGYIISDLALPSSILLFLYSIILQFSRIFNNYRNLTKKVISVQDDERNRIARDLHDTVGQSLAVLKLRLQMLASKISDPQKDIKNDLDLIVNNVSSTIEEVRNIVMDIKPTFLEKTDIIDAIKWYGEKFLQKTNIKISFKSNVDILDLDLKTKDTIFKIFLEILSNVIKHSEASLLNVEIVSIDDIISFKIEDNGKGFNKSLIKSGSGLQNMTDRIEIIGGTLNIISKENKGTKIMITVQKK